MSFFIDCLEKSNRAVVERWVLTHRRDWLKLDLVHRGVFSFNPLLLPLAFSLSLANLLASSPSSRAPFVSFHRAPEGFQIYISL